MKLFTNKGLIVVLAMCTIGFGQGSRMGTASSTQLQIAQGARYLSGGGAAAMADGMDAAYWNPAGLAMGENNVDAISSYRSYLADTGSNYFGVAGSFGALGKLGITARTFSIGEVKETTVFYPDGTGQMFTPSFMILGTTLSKKLSNRTSVGVNANWVSESFGRVSTNALAFDVGVQYRSLMDIENLNVGFVLKNFGGPVTYDGEGLGVVAQAGDANRPDEYYKVDAASFDLPFTMEMSASYNLAGLDFGGTYSSNYYATDKMTFLAAYSLMDMATLRVGYQTSGVAQSIEDEDTSWYTDPFDGLSFGASLNLESLIGMNLSVDYAFMQTKYFSDNQVIALRDRKSVV